MMLGVDASFLLALDWGLTLEVTAAMIFIAAQTHAIATAQVLHLRYLKIMKRFRAFARRGSARARRPRGPKALSPPDDESAQLAYA
jgi:hypothetical protein